MTAKSAQKIITANDLLSGEVVYLTASGKWSHVHTDALMFDDTKAGARLAEVQRRDTAIVGAVLAGAAMGANGPSPIHFREVFRATGPSNRLIGKQAHTVEFPPKPEHVDVQLHQL